MGKNKICSRTYMGITLHAKYNKHGWLVGRMIEVDGNLGKWHRVTSTRAVEKMGFIKSEADLGIDWKRLT